MFYRVFHLNCVLNMFASYPGLTDRIEDIPADSDQIIVNGLIPGILKLILLVLIFLSVNLCGLMTFASFFRTTFVN